MVMPLVPLALPTEYTWTATVAASEQLITSAGLFVLVTVNTAPDTIV